MLKLRDQFNTYGYQKRSSSILVEDNICTELHMTSNPETSP